MLLRKLLLFAGRRKRRNSPSGWQQRRRLREEADSLEQREEEPVVDSLVAQRQAQPHSLGVVQVVAFGNQAHRRQPEALEALARNRPRPAVALADSARSLQRLQVLVVALVGSGRSQRVHQPPAVGSEGLARSRQGLQPLRADSVDSVRNPQRPQAEVEVSVDSARNLPQHLQVVEEDSVGSERRRSRQRVAFPLEAGHPGHPQPAGFPLGESKRKEIQEHQKQNSKKKGVMRKRLKL